MYIHIHAGELHCRSPSRKLDTRDVGEARQLHATTMDSESPVAPEHLLPTTHFYSIEYPGYVQPSSVPLAIRTLGGQSSLETAFKRNATKTETLLELNLRPGNPFSHPITGDVVATNNILMKVVKRKRRRLNGEGDFVGEYTAEAVGVIPKTGRFRSELKISIFKGFG
jgi:general transcription factor 3C polypeptide 5 (transcription factor C subunit 1)